MGANRWRLGAALVVVMVLAGSMVTSLAQTRSARLSPSTGEPVPSTSTSSGPTSSTAAPPTSHAGSMRAQEIAEDVWFRWFDAIHRQDEELLHAAVASRAKLEDGLANFGDVSFDRPPTRDGVVLHDLEVLLDRADCLVVYADLDVSAFRPVSEERHFVTVLWHDRKGWRLAATWLHRGDLWRNDCDLRLRGEV